MYLGGVWGERDANLLFLTQGLEVQGWERSGTNTVLYHDLHSTFPTFSAQLA